MLFCSRCYLYAVKKIRVLGSFKLPVPPVLLPFLGFAAKWRAHPWVFSHQNDAIHLFRWQYPRHARVHNLLILRHQSIWFLPLWNASLLSTIPLLPLLRATWFDLLPHLVMEELSAITCLMFTPSFSTSLPRYKNSSMEGLCCKVRDVTWSYESDYISIFEIHMCCVWIQLFGLRTWS